MGKKGVLASTFVPVFEGQPGFLTLVFLQLVKAGKKGGSEEDATFTNSLKNQLQPLSTKYKGYVARLGKTGAGLAPEEIRPGEIHNMFDLIVAEFPPFAQLHEWWHSLPNYNPIHVSNSCAGQNPGQRVLDLMGVGGNGSDDLEEEGLYEGVAGDVLGEAEEVGGALDDMDTLARRFGKMDHDQSSSVSVSLSPTPAVKSKSPSSGLIASQSWPSIPRVSVRKDPISTLLEIKAEGHWLCKEELDYRRHRLEVE
ncbi:hypothetical protein FRC08_000316 [Ceratobasidium sp. 394]|nr:hypothetical protein FRC08_000316 [Ceratobasidium sp. 394]KAG9096948.1 hypothetical protein FS749_007398 [Ceratobasidium sp. UAMH 11750]